MVVVVIVVVVASGRLWCRLWGLRRALCILLWLVNDVQQLHPADHLIFNVVQLMQQQIVRFSSALNDACKERERERERGREREREKRRERKGERERERE